MGGMAAEGAGRDRSRRLGDLLNAFRGLMRVMIAELRDCGEDGSLVLAEDPDMLLDCVKRSVDAFGAWMTRRGVDTEHMAPIMPDCANEPLLLQAAELGLPDIAAALLDAGSSPHGRIDDDSTRPLLWALCNLAPEPWPRALPSASVRVMHLLLERDPSVIYGKNLDGRGVLHHAAEARAPLTLFRHFIAAGAELDAVDLAGESVLSETLLSDFQAAMAQMDERRPAGRQRLETARSGEGDLTAVDMGADHLRLLLKCGADPMVLHEDGQTVLTVLVRQHQYRCSPSPHRKAMLEAYMRFLVVEGGVDVDHGDDEGMTALHHALRLRLPCCAEMLRGLGADVCARDAKGRTAFATAVEALCLDGLDLLLTRGARADDDHGPRGWLPLVALAKSCSFGPEALALEHLAPWCRDSPELRHTLALDALAMVDRLLDKGANIDEQDREGRTALHHAVLSSSCAMVRRLLSAGANADLPDTHGMTPVFYAAERSLEKTALLLRHGCSVQHMDKRGITVLRHVMFVPELVEWEVATYYGCDPDGGEELPQEILFQVVQLLLQNGCDVNTEALSRRASGGSDVLRESPRYPDNAFGDLAGVGGDRAGKFLKMFLEVGADVELYGGAVLHEYASATGAVHLRGRQTFPRNEHTRFLGMVALGTPRFDVVVQLMRHGARIQRPTPPRLQRKWEGKFLKPWRAGSVALPRCLFLDVKPWLLLSVRRATLRRDVGAEWMRPIEPDAFTQGMTGLSEVLIQKIFGYVVGRDLKFGSVPSRPADTRGCSALLGKRPKDDHIE